MSNSLIMRPEHRSHLSIQMPLGTCPSLARPHSTPHNWLAWNAEILARQQLQGKAAAIKHVVVE